MRLLIYDYHKHNSIRLRTYYFFLIIIGFLTFFNSLFNNFVWLDKAYIVNNKTLIQMNLPSLMQSVSSTGGGHYRPLTSFYYAFIYLLSNNKPFLFHSLQLILRVTVSCLLFSIFSYFFEQPISLLISTLYLVHPINESIPVFISNSADSLYIFFGILTLFLVIKKKLAGNKRIILFSLLLLSLLAKEAGILFFGGVILFIFLYRKKEFKFYAIGETLIFALYLSIRFLSQGFTKIDTTLIPIMNLSFSQRLLSVPKVIFYYLQNFVWPFSIGINNLWYVKAVTFNNFYFPLIIDLLVFSLICLFGIFIFKHKKNIFKTYFFFSLIFLFGLLPYTQFIPLDYTVAGRWFAFAMIGMLGILAVLMETIYENQKKILLSIGFIVIFLLSLRTIYKNTFWNSDLSLFSYAVTINNNFSNEYFLARALYASGQYKSALYQIESSEKKYTYDHQYALEGNILEKLGYIQEANQAYGQMLKLKHDPLDKFDEQTYIEVSQYLIRNNEYTKAESLLYEAIPLNWNSENTWILFAYTEYLLHKKEQAIAALQQAYRINSRSGLILSMFNEIYKNNSVNPKLVSVITE